eukprot:6487950-Amphidinium_carterae.2
MRIGRKFQDALQDQPPTFVVRFISLGCTCLWSFGAKNWLPQAVANQFEWGQWERHKVIFCHTLMVEDMGQTLVVHAVI